MNTLLQRIFLQNWQRKAISVTLAVFIWFAVNYSLTATRTISHIPVRIANVPPGKLIEGMLSNGFLTRRMTLSIVGNKALLDNLTSNDLEVVIDAKNKEGEWIASVSRKNLVSVNPEIDLKKGISRVFHQKFLIRMNQTNKDTAQEVHDQGSRTLRLDYGLMAPLPLDKPLPVSLFIPPEFMGKIAPESLNFAPSKFVEKIGTSYVLTPQLCIKGVSPTFLKVVREMLQLVITVAPNRPNAPLDWNLQLINPRLLEDRYVSQLLYDPADHELSDFEPTLREEILRTRFRSYMNRLQLCLPDDGRLQLKIELHGNTLEICNVLPS